MKFTCDQCKQFADGMVQRMNIIASKHEPRLLFTLPTARSAEGHFTDRLHERFNSDESLRTIRGMLVEIATDHVPKIVKLVQQESRVLFNFHYNSFIIAMSASNGVCQLRTAMIGYGTSREKVHKIALLRVNVLR